LVGWSKTVAVNINHIIKYIYIEGKKREGRRTEFSPQQNQKSEEEEEKKELVITFRGGGCIIHYTLFIQIHVTKFVTKIGRNWTTKERGRRIRTRTISAEGRRPNEVIFLSFFCLFECVL
jgi:hypothetical protein